MYLWKRFIETDRETVWFQTTWTVLHLVGACMNLGSAIFHAVAAAKYRKIRDTKRKAKGRMGF